MVDNPVGTAMELDDGKMSVVVYDRWKVPLTDYLARRHVEFQGPVRLNILAPYRLFEILIDGGTENEFREWSADLLLIVTWAHGLLREGTASVVAHL